MNPTLPYVANQLQVHNLKVGCTNLTGNPKLTAVARSIRDITNGRGLDDVTDHELLDGLVLRDAASAVGATHGLDMATVVLAASSVTPFLGLEGIEKVISEYAPKMFVYLHRNAMLKRMSKRWHRGSIHGIK